MPECVKQMRIQAEELGQLYYVYVVDDDDRLKGVFPLKKMITNPSASKIKHVMRKDPVSVKTDTPINDVAMTFEKIRLGSRTGDRQYRTFGRADYGRRHHGRSS